MNLSKRVLAPALMATLLVILLIQLPGMAAERSSIYKWFDPVLDVVKTIQTSYVEDITDEEMIAMQQGAINGLIETLDDPYTVFIPNEMQKQFDKEMGGFYVGIGAGVRKIDGWITIISPMAGSPALEAGVKAGDQIRAVDGETTENELIDDTIKRLMGEPGTDVVITVRRTVDDEETDLDLVVTRRSIKVQTVEGVHRIGEDWDYYVDPVNKIAYIRLNQFTGTSLQELVESMQPLLDDGMKGLVFDLRFNPGGLLEAAVRISDLFIPQGRIVTVKGRTSSQEYSWDAHENATLPNFPMVVLVNGDSASASEIVSGALKDNNRAIVLGSRTFGKGKVQDVRNLESGVGRLKITTSYYFLPSGQNIQKLPDSNVWGVDPSDGFYIPLTNEEYLELRTAENELNVISDTNGEGEWGNPNWITERLHDPQLAAAVKAIQIKLDTDEWQPTGGVMDPNAEIFEELKQAERARDFLIEQLEITQTRLDQLMAFVPADEDDQTEPENDEALTNLLPEEYNLDGGIIEIRDANGELIATLNIEEDDNLEEALNQANLVPVEN